MYLKGMEIANGRPFSGRLCVKSNDIAGSGRIDKSESKYHAFYTNLLRPYIRGAQAVGGAIRSTLFPLA